MTIGVLAYQGSFAEHLAACQRAGLRAIPVRNTEDLKKIDRIILPGGESTTISKILHRTGFFGQLKKRIEEGMPVWGTCAGCILMATEVEGLTPQLSIMDMKVVRNAYGSQLDSFTVLESVEGITDGPMPLEFIRAPVIECVGKDVRILKTVEGRIVAAQQGNRLATTFHPELTDRGDFHLYFSKL